MKTVIIEDERKSLEHLKRQLTNLPQISLVGEAMNAKESIRLITSEEPELVFLDIQLQESTGFEILASLGEYHFDVIFTTAYDQYGIQAVKCSALDYLLKPVKLSELTFAVQKAVKKKEYQLTGEKIQNLLSIVNRPKKDHKIAIQLMREIRFIDPAEIIRCEAHNNYTNIYINSGETLLASKGLFEFVNTLTNYDFIRCHQSHLVNKKYIKSIYSIDSVYELLLVDKITRIPISRLKKEYVKQKLLDQS